MSQTSRYLRSEVAERGFKRIACPYSLFIWNISILGNRFFLLYVLHCILINLPYGVCPKEKENFLSFLFTESNQKLPCNFFFTKMSSVADTWRNGRQSHRALKLNQKVPCNFFSENVQCSRYMATWAAKSQVFQIKSRYFKSFDEKHSFKWVFKKKISAEVFELWFFKRIIQKRCRLLKILKYLFSPNRYLPNHSLSNIFD